MEAVAGTLLSTPQVDLTSTKVSKNNIPTKKLSVDSSIIRTAFLDLKDSLSDHGAVPEILSKVAPFFVALNVLGSVDFGPDPGARAFQTLVQTSVWLNVSRIILKRYARVIGKDTFQFVYPDIRGDKVPLSEVEKLLTDGARGVYDLTNVPQKLDKSNDFTDAEWRQKLYPLTNYKKNLFNLATREIRTLEEANFVWMVTMKSPDPDIKLQGVQILTDKCRPFLKDFISSQSVFSSKFEERVVGRLKNNWWDIPDVNVSKIGDTIENISVKRQLQNAQIIYEKMSPSLVDFPPTLVPLLKLFIARKMKDEVLKNNIPSPGDPIFVDTISTEFMRRMKRLGVLDREKAYLPEEATVGFEMQPKGNNKSEISVTKMNADDIRNLVRYAGLGWQNDMPFEIVFPPTRTPIVQVLMLAESCNLTGVPISEVGLQISFGGLTTESNIKALQRVMIAEGRLESDHNIAAFGNAWDLGSAQKGEVNIREVGSGTVVITPSDLEHPEFSNVGEYRASVASKDFFTFYRGILNAYNLANAAKAFERGKKGYQLTDTESKKAELFVQLKSNFNYMCVMHGLPPIDGQWTKKDWMSFGKLIESKSPENIKSPS